MFSLPGELPGSSSSSGSKLDAFLDQQVRIRLTKRLSPVSSSSGGPAGGTYEIEGEFNGETIINSVFDIVGDLSDIQFFNIALPNKDLADGESTLGYHFDRITVAGTNLTKQECDEPDIVSVLSVPQGIDYDPGNGYSNDFGTARAVNQFTRLPLTSFMLEQNFTVEAITDRLVQDRQYLDAVRGPNHKYAIFDCAPSVVSDPGGPSGYVFSAAFKYVLGDPRVGIVLGYQDGDDRDIFWSIVLDLNSKQFVYGFHHVLGSGHHFVPATTWIPVPDQANWSSFDWHRMVIRVTFGAGSYGISMWLDPFVVGLSSSSSLSNLTKVISVDYASATYAVVKPAWGGSTDFGPLQFADGRPGVYVVGGEARIAEFTVSPVSENIAVPNKVPWLGA